MCPRFVAAAFIQGYILHDSRFLAGRNRVPVEPP